jgi:hypothetical protein
MHGLAVSSCVVVIQFADQPQELGPVELVCSLLCGDGSNDLGVDVATGRGLGARPYRWCSPLGSTRKDDLARRLVHRGDMPARRLPSDRPGSVGVVALPRAMQAR